MGTSGNNRVYVSSFIETPSATCQRCIHHQTCRRDVNVCRVAKQRETYGKGLAFTIKEAVKMIVSIIATLGIIWIIAFLFALM